MRKYLFDIFVPNSVVLFSLLFIYFNFFSMLGLKTLYVVLTVFEPTFIIYSVKYFFLKLMQSSFFLKRP